MFRLISGVFMGWSLGSNDSANVFGTAVFSKKVSYRTAVTLTAVFIIIGALLQGYKGMHTLGGLTRQTMDTAFIASLSAALTVTLMTFSKLPVSTSQAMVGAIIGIGLNNWLKNGEELNFSGMAKVLLAWVGTPIGAIAVACALYALLGKIIDSLPVNIFTRDWILKVGIIVAGCYGAYALGANNVANVTGVYTKTGLLTEFQAVLIGSVSMALGAVTFSKNVMMTVGQKLVKLDPFSALIAVLSEAIVVHFYALLGVPVSTSQAIIGAVLGIGLLKGVQTINLKTLLSILMGWLGTPAIALTLSFLIYRIVD